MPWKACWQRFRERDANGADLATANLDGAPELRLSIPKYQFAMGTKVLTLGYPFTDSKEESAGIRFRLNMRYLEGYITRSFFYEHSEGRTVLSYELSFPAPEGLSGAPLILADDREVIGVIYGNNDVGTIEEFSKVDPATGRRESEVRRMVSFGLAHHTEVFLKLRGKATEGLPLAEYLDREREKSGVG